MCCMYSIKQNQLIMGALPLADVTVHYIDIRAVGKGYDEFFEQAKAMGANFVKGRVAGITEVDGGNLVLRYEDVENGGQIAEAEYDLVVLAVGVQPNRDAARLFHVEELALDAHDYVDEVDEDAQSLSEHLDGGGGLDASLLALPLRKVVPADHPRMIATTDAVADRLSAGDGLLYRYLHDQSPDGLAGDEGAFLLCSFWLVENLALQGRVEQAEDLYASLCSRASPLGLLPEQIDPSSGTFMGNFPQAFSHIGVIAGGVTLARAREGRTG